MELNLLDPQDMYLNAYNFFVALDRLLTLFFAMQKRNGLLLATDSEDRSDFLVLSMAL